MAKVIDLQNVVVKRSNREILKAINLSLDASERWVILGPNGAGKTTLLRVLAAQIQPSSGKAMILDENLGEVNVFELRTRIGAQIPNSESVLNAVMTASYGITGRWREEYDAIDERRARRVLAEWQLSEFEDRPIGTLSDGEKKRVQIARSIMTDPELLLLDEPVASLDMAAREQTISLLSGYAMSATAPAMAMVTHHIEEIPAGFTHALLLQDGAVVARGEIASTLTSEAISETFRYPLKVTREDGRFRATAR